MAFGDFFGGGPPSAADHDATFKAAQFGIGQSHAHGYHVLGIAAASLEGASTTCAGDPCNRDRVVGAFPDTILVRAADIVGGPDPTDPTKVTKLTSAAHENRMIQRVKPSTTTSRMVLNTSLGYACCKCDVGCCTECLTEERARNDAGKWIEKVRAQLALESGLVHVDSAGNKFGFDAALNDRWAAARLLPDLVKPGTTEPLPNLENVIVVENLLPGPDSCLANSSNAGGTLSAVGTNVYSMLDAATQGNLTGTSMAAPQVAAAAAQLFAIAPELESDEVVFLLESSSWAPETWSSNCLDTSPARRLDVYAALLALDAFEQGSPRVRRAILDVSGVAGAPDGHFDESDLEAFVDAFLPGGEVPVDFSETFARADLNGDGFVGGPGVAPASSSHGAFDLDGDGHYGEVSFTVDGVEYVVDETAAADHQILCYFAHSDLYEGDEAERAEILGPTFCGCGAKPSTPVRYTEARAEYRVVETYPEYWEPDPEVDHQAGDGEPVTASVAEGAVLASTEVGSTNELSSLSVKGHVEIVYDPDRRETRITHYPTVNEALTSTDWRNQIQVFPAPGEEPSSLRLRVGVVTERNQVAEVEDGAFDCHAEEFWVDCDFVTFFSLSLSGSSSSPDASVKGYDLEPGAYELTLDFEPGDRIFVRQATSTHLRVMSRVEKEVMAELGYGSTLFVREVVDENDVPVEPNVAYVCSGSGFSY